MFKIRKLTGENYSSKRQEVDWDKNNLFLNYSFNIVTQFSSAFVSFVIAWAISRTSGTEILAITVALTAGSQTILLFSNWSLIAISRLGTEEFIKTGKISTVFFARTVILGVNILLLFLFYPLWSPYILGLLKLPESAGIFLLIQFTLLSFLANMTGGFQAAKLLRMQGILLLVEKIISLLLLLLFYFFSDLDWQRIMISYLSSALLVIILAVILLRKYLLFSFDSKQILRVLRFAFPLVPYSFIAFLTTNYLDTFFISNYLEKNDLGIYSIAYQFYGFWMQLPTILGGLILPMFISYTVHNKLDIAEKYLRDQMHVVLLVWTFLSAILSLVLCLIIPRIYGIGHNQLAQILLSFILGTTFALPNLIGFSPYTLARKIVFFALPLVIVTAGINFFGNILLIPRYGLIGSTYATILSAFSSFIVTFFFILYYFNINTYKSLVVLLPAAIGITLCFYAINLFIIVGTVAGLTIGFAMFYKNDFFSLTRFVKGQLFKIFRVAA